MRTFDTLEYSRKMANIFSGESCLNVQCVLIMVRYKYSQTCDIRPAPGTTISGLNSQVVSLHRLWHIYSKSQTINISLGGLPGEWSLNTGLTFITENIQNKMKPVLRDHSWKTTLRHKTTIVVHEVQIISLISKPFSVFA